MNLRKKAPSLFSVTGLLLSMTAGVAFAQTVDTDSDITPLNVTCADTVEIDVEVNGVFSVDVTLPPGPLGYSASMPGGFTVKMDLTCNWSTNFEVSAEIEDFVHDGSVPLSSAQASTFPGGHLSWLRTTPINFNGPDEHGIAGPPAVSAAAFVLEDQSEIMQNNYDLIVAWPPFVAVASPGVTIATWDGFLTFLPSNLGEGTYNAPLTATLTVN